LEQQWYHHCLYLTASAINYNAPTPPQPNCQTIGHKHAFYPYYKCVELKEYTKNVWISQIPFVFQSMQFGLRMVVILLNENENNVLIYSPIPITQETKDKIKNVYKWNVKYLIAPNSIHHLFLQDWITEFPEVIVIAPPNLKERRNDIQFDHVFDIDVDDNDWNVKNIPKEIKHSCLDIMVVKTGIFHEEIVLFHKDTKTLIVADHIENIGYSPETEECKNFPIMYRIIVSLMGMRGRPSAPADMKLTVNRDWYRKSVQKIMEWDFDKIVPSHGRMVENNAKDIYVAANAFVL